MSVYHGILGLVTPHAVEHVTIGMCVLAFSFLIESYSLRVAYNEVRRGTPFVLTVCRVQGLGIPVWKCAGRGTRILGPHAVLQPVEKAVFQYATYRLTRRTFLYFVCVS